MSNKFFYVIIAFLVVVIILQIVILTTPPSKSSLSTFDGEKIKELANTLLNKELYTQAISEYSRYLEKAVDLDTAKRTNVLYMIANTYYEKLKDYESALEYYYRAKFYEPEGELLKQINRKIVFCLEKLERSIDAKNELENAVLYSDENKEKKDDKSPIIAKIDERIITMQDLDSEIEKLPLSMQSEFDIPETLLDNQGVADRMKAVAGSA